MVCGPDYRVGNRLSGQERTLRLDQFSTHPPGPQLPAGQGGTQTPPSLFSSWNLTLWMASAVCPAVHLAACPAVHLAACLAGRPAEVPVQKEREPGGERGPRTAQPHTPGPQSHSDYTLKWDVQSSASESGRGAARTGRPAGLGRGCAVCAHSAACCAFVPTVRGSVPPAFMPVCLPRTRGSGRAKWGCGAVRGPQTPAHGSQGRRRPKSCPSRAERAGVCRPATHGPGANAQHCRPRRAASARRAAQTLLLGDWRPACHPHPSQNARQREGSPQKECYCVITAGDSLLFRCIQGMLL